MLTVSTFILGSENISVTKTEKNPAIMELSFSWVRQIINKSAENIIHSQNESLSLKKYYLK